MDRSSKVKRKKAGGNEEVSGIRSQTSVVSRGPERPVGMQAGDQVDSGNLGAGRGTGRRSTGLPSPWGSEQRVAPTGRAIARQGEGFRQPGWDAEDAEAEVTAYEPNPWSVGVRPRYRRDTLEPWMHREAAKTKIITLRQARPKKPGDLFGSPTTYWLLACPRCGAVAELDHVVIIMQDAITINPSVICPSPGCGWRDVVQGWELKRA